MEALHDQSAAPPDTVQYALAYAELGIHIVMLGDRGSDRAKIPRFPNWGKRATTDEDQIVECFENHPKANIGALLGPEGGIIDVEFDTPEGRATADKLFEGEVTATYESVRSIHRLFKWTRELPSIQKIEKNGLEVRLGGGGKQTQSVLPPSIHPSGTAYRWLPGLSPMEVDFAELPASIVLKICNGEDFLGGSPADEMTGDRRDWSEIENGVAKGGRNNAATAWAGKLWREVDDLDDPNAPQRVLRELQKWNAKNVEPLPDRELRGVVMSIYGKEKKRRAGGGTAGGVSTAQRGKKRVIVNNEEADVADQVIEEIGKLGWESDSIDESVRVYCRNGSLVQVVTSEDPITRGQPRICELHPAQTRLVITQACDLVAPKGPKGELSPTRQSQWLTHGVHYRKSYRGHIRPLAGITSAPTIRPDGTILQTPGYDRDTGLLYRPGAEFPRIPEHPSREDAAAAWAKLQEVVADMPFQEEADKSAWGSLVLTQSGRHSIAGPVPIFPVDGNVAGTGKSLSVDAASMISYGHPAARQVFTRDDDEMRKLITTLAIEATPSVLFDNLDVQLGGATLDAALTAEEWTGRILGRSQSTGRLPLRIVICATSNNGSLGTDVARRALLIRLRSPLETPEDRDDFRHPDLLGWVRQERPRLVVAALTILRAYFAAGCPAQPGGAWGSYSEWSRIIRGALVWAGAADPMATREGARANDDSRALLHLLISGLVEADPDGNGLTTAEIERLVSHRPDEMPTCPALTEAAAMVCGPRFNSRRFAGRLRSYIGRVWDGRQIERTKGHAGFTRWSVSQSPGDGESQAAAVSPKTETHHQSHRPKTSKKQGENNNGDSGESVSNSSAYTLNVSTPHKGASHVKGVAGKGDSPYPPESPPPDRCVPQCDPGDYAEMADGGSINTTCRRCRRFIGRRPATEIAP